MYLYIYILKKKYVSVSLLLIAYLKEKLSSNLTFNYLQNLQEKKNIKQKLASTIF